MHSCRHADDHGRHALPASVYISGRHGVGVYPCLGPFALRTMLPDARLDDLYFKLQCACDPDYFLYVYSRHTCTKTVLKEPLHADANGGMV